MFYSTQILAKKGPLGLVWIAAHLDRQLKKQQISNASIPITVDTIMNPEAPLALRLSGQLLLGVVRIYSRKVGYLYDDCNEALVKIKLAFKPVNVDLPAGGTRAHLEEITVPYQLDDLDLVFAADQLDTYKDLTAMDLPVHIMTGRPSFSLSQDISEVFGMQSMVVDGEERFEEFPFDLEEIEVERLRAASQSEAQGPLAAVGVMGTPQWAPSRESPVGFKAPEEEPMEIEVEGPTSAPEPLLARQDAPLSPLTGLTPGRPSEAMEELLPMVPGDLEIQFEAVGGPPSSSDGLTAEGPAIFPEESPPAAEVPHVAQPEEGQEEVQEEQQARGEAASPLRRNARRAATKVPGDATKSGASPAAAPSPSRATPGRRAHVGRHRVAVDVSNEGLPQTLLSTREVRAIIMDRGPLLRARSQVSTPEREEVGEELMEEEGGWPLPPAVGLALAPELQEFLQVAAGQLPVGQVLSTEARRTPESDAAGRVRTDTSSSGLAGGAEVAMESSPPLTYTPERPRLAPQEGEKPPDLVSLGSQPSLPLLPQGPQEGVEVTPGVEPEAVHEGGQESSLLRLTPGSDVDLQLVPPEGLLPDLGGDMDLPLYPEDIPPPGQGPDGAPEPLPPTTTQQVSQAQSPGGPESPAQRSSQPQVEVVSPTAEGPEEEDANLPVPADPGLSAYQTRRMLYQLKSLLVSTAQEALPSSSAATPRKRKRGGEEVPAIEPGPLTISLASMVAGKARLDAARTFYEVLVLTNKNLLELQQTSPYEDITIIPHVAALLAL